MTSPIIFGLDFGWIPVLHAAVLFTMFSFTQLGVQHMPVHVANPHRFLNIYMSDMHRGVLASLSIPHRLYIIIYIIYGIHTILCTMCQ